MVKDHALCVVESSGASHEARRGARVVDCRANARGMS